MDPAETLMRSVGGREIDRSEASRLFFPEEGKLRARYTHDLSAAVIWLHHRSALADDEVLIAYAKRVKGDYSEALFYVAPGYTFAHRAVDLGWSLDMVFSS